MITNCDFTFEWYSQFLKILKQNYTIIDYHTQMFSGPCVILRHDIDNSIKKALVLARLEASMGVKSTFFVMLKTDFYNPFSAKNLQILHELKYLGHEIGLHFDEMAYSSPPPKKKQNIIDNIHKEIMILSNILQTQINTISLHRPSQKNLKANLHIPGIINSYSDRFFKDFKYVSDSRQHWKEPIMDIITSGEYPRLHILTHAFWYHDKTRTISETIREFIDSSVAERYEQVSENITDLGSILPFSEIINAT